MNSTIHTTSQSTQAASIEQSLTTAVETALFEIAHGDAAWRSCAIAMIKKSIQTTNKHKFHDLEVRIAPALFRRFAKQNGERVAWVIHSSFGVERDVASAAHLAALLLPELECQCQARKIGRHVRIDAKSSFFCIASRSLEDRLHASGLLPCPVCPSWSNSNKSLWWHLQAQHATAHHEATKTAAYHEQRDSTAMVVYDHNQGGKINNESYNVSYNEEESTTKNHRTAIISQTPSSPHQCSDTPWDAVKSGSLEVLQRLLSETSFDIHADRDRHGSLLIHWAAGGGYLATVRYLVESLHSDPCAKQVGHRSFEGRTPLHWAARNGHEHVVDFLLTLSEVRTHVDATTADGTTAFCWAAWQGHQLVLERLWKAGCNVRASNRFGCNASLWAAQGRASAATLAWLVERDCPVVVVNNSNHGVFHKAAQRGNKEICEWLVDQLDVETFSWSLIGPDSDRAAPSDLAGMEGHTLLAEWLSKVEMTLVLRFSSFVSPPDWLTPYSSEARADWEPGGGVLRMRSVYKQ